MLLSGVGSNGCSFTLAVGLMAPLRHPLSAGMMTKVTVRQAGDYPYPTQVGLSNLR